MVNIEPIKEAVRLAANLCAQVQRHYLSRTDKDNREPVTIADYGSQAIIGRALMQHYPHDAVIAEESGQQFRELLNAEQKTQVLSLLSNLLDISVVEAVVTSWLDQGRGKKAAQTWVIDPIDGTKGFLAMRQYAIGVGLLVNGELAGSVMAAPGYAEGMGALFYAENNVAYREPLAASEEGLRLQVSNRTDPFELRIVQSFERAHASKERMAMVRQRLDIPADNVEELDSMVKYALVASGEADIYLRLPRKDNEYAHRAWDHAAGVALVLAAGGSVTDLVGNPLDFSQGAILPHTGMVATNGHIHNHVLEVIQEVMAETGG